MRINKAKRPQNAFSILTVDDDPIMTSTVQAYFQRSGYCVDTENDPYRAIERVREGSYDILLLDFLMTPICGDQVVEQIRKFNHELFIVLLTGHKSMAPPIRTIRELEIQGYYEKSDRFDQLELLVESCVKAIAQMRTIRGYQSELTALVDALPELYHLDTLPGIADSILRALPPLFRCTDALLLLDPSQYAAAPTPVQYLSRTMGQHLWADPPAALMQLFQTDRAARWDDGAHCLTVPLVRESGVLTGVLRICLEQAPDQYQCQLGLLFARQASAAIENAALHTRVNAQYQELTQANAHLRDSYVEMISAMRLMVDAKDIYTRGHSDRVSKYAVAIARQLGRDEAYCQRLGIAGLFHDIGKLAIPDAILLKTSALTAEEYGVVKAHCTNGANILSAISHFRDIVPFVLGHHERFDGTGYPNGLAGTEIPEQARILAVADSFDAMTSDRQYRASLGRARAIDELQKGRGTQFDPAFVDAFLRCLPTLEETDFLHPAAVLPPFLS